ncbi:pyruvate dehydrogenase complex dihydrolipoamide acetyltransferase [Bartonella tamiae]|uniref:Acetyltransferase component of pyruvate dehydrogenase complex n=1 Tax=Bartonella tamiae Th239 TaxID=1094558 RepID=J1K002_9HYPH|nr:pyruvate dehydrogenase complex dihydrolipoamide acetyltransferase [Bartonella tamiae]EJF90722.1 pyruvate dehydrogenase complex dihydrolipoamide acetyltransferase [Bartonella tamiae Th239]EJF93901.1 pyruvate dehydrogenase complex dihydrolipoamide acetyltransferase [Bartonella tamiae Th307]
MPIKITMPALSPTMEEGNLAKWNVKEGDKVSSGDVIAEIETDKATMEVESIDEGTVAKIIVPEGTQGVKVNALIAILAEEGEDTQEAVKKAESSSSAQPTEQHINAETENNEQKTVESVMDKKAETASTNERAFSLNQFETPKKSGDGTKRVFASPLARRLASQNSLDLNTLSGTGPHGRIIKRDVDKALANGSTQKSVSTADQNISNVSSSNDEQILKLFHQDEYEIVPHDGMRKTIAKRLVESKQTVPHFYVTIDCELDSLLKMRSELNNAAPMQTNEHGEKPSYRLSVNDFIIKATAMALKAIPDANVSWMDSGMIRHKYADVGVAVSIPNGLITPIVRHADEKSLSTISNEMKDLAKRARDRKLKPDEYQGGTTAVSNMGMFGVKDFAAIINPPHATIFAIGAGEERAIVKNGAVTIATMMSVTISTDHRAVDGALAAELAQAFKKLIENPLSMLV